MIKQLIFIALTILLCSASFKDTECDLTMHYLPEPMSVQGTAAVSLEPELVVINFSVKTLELIAEKSLEGNSIIVSRAIEAIKNLGVSEKEISTTNLSIHPEYENKYNKSTQQYTNIFKGYRVQNQIHIRSKQLKSAGKIIDVAIKNGVNSVESVSFDASTSSKKAAKDKLIQEAVKDAKQRAQLALTALDHSIEGVKNVRIDNNEPIYQNRNNYKMAYAAMDMMEDDSSVETPLYSNDIILQSSVTVDFLIKAN